APASPCLLYASCFITSLSICFFFFLIRPPLRSTLFPYTTLFRSSSFSGILPVLYKAIICFSFKVSYLSKASAMILCFSLLSLTRSEEHTSELQSRFDLVCRLLLEKKKKSNDIHSLY